VRGIPYGQVTSYGRLAGLVGSRGAARAAGSAVGRNPIGLLVPCHRVIAGDGTIGGYGGSWWGGREQLLAIKRELLTLEGVRLPTTSFVG
jgi:methylated-DNA-[protein]-cysteine S-methyltransferase